MNLSKIFVSLRSNFVYLAQALLWFLFSFLIGYWLTTAGEIPDLVRLFLYGIQIITFFAGLTYVFLFGLDLAYAGFNVEKNGFQHGVITVLFVIIGFALSTVWLFTFFYSLAPGLSEFNLKLKLTGAVTEVDVKNFDYFNQSPGATPQQGLWVKTASGINVELSQLAVNQTEQVQSFKLKRIGSISFFTHNCFDGLDMSRTDLTSLLMGDEIKRPNDIILRASVPNGYTMIDRLKFFAQFDSLVLENSQTSCNQVSVNDYDTKSHRFGRAVITVNDEKQETWVRYDDKDSQYVSVLDSTTLEEKVNYKTAKGYINVVSPGITGTEGVFLSIEDQKKVVLIRNNQVYEYTFSEGDNFYPIAAVNFRNVLIGVAKGELVFIGLRHSKSRNTLILDKISLL